MTPRQFLLFGGIILVALAVLGMFVLGPTPDASILGSFFWLDNAENLGHALFGVIALLAYFFLKDEQLAKWLVALVGVVAAVLVVANFMGSSTPNFGPTNLESPSDLVLHLVVALWAFYAAFVGGKASSVTTAV